MRILKVLTLCQSAKVKQRYLSLPDIALIYTAKDFRVIDTKHLEDSQQLNQYLKDCLEDTNSDAFQGENIEKVHIGSKYKSGHAALKYLKPSPCLNLKKTSKCSQYCTWHKHFFEDMPKREFLTLMTYARPQRKIR